MGVVCECVRCVRGVVEIRMALFPKNIFKAEGGGVVFKYIDMRTLPSRQLNHTAGICGVVG